MSFSIQTNVNSLIAQENLRVNSDFQSRTIQRLTSGFRINQSGDDAAGLSIANQYRIDRSELTQGVRNANDGISQLQIVDGGLSNISTMLDRMKTLATQAASATFTGDRNTVDQEYQQLLGEITRQAANIGLNQGGLMQKNLSVYIGGGRTSTQAGSATLSIDLSNTSVDAAGLGLTGTTVAGGSAGVDMANSGGASRLDNPAVKFLNGSATQAFTFNYTDGAGAVQSRTVTVTGTAAGISGNEVITALNTGLAGTGITARIDTSTANAGKLQFSSVGAFTAYAAAASGGTGVTSAADHVENGGMYSASSQAALVAWSGGATEDFTVTDGTKVANIQLSTANIGGTGSVANMAAYINSQLAAAGVKVTALAANNGTQISFQSAASFSIVESAYAAGGGAGQLFAAVGNQTVTAANPSATGGTNAQAAIASIDQAVKALGLVQGTVGSGQNKLGYSISLAQSQIASFSAAESRIRDADIASEAANLTKAQVLQQASMAAMAQANSAPQAVLALLRG